MVISQHFTDAQGAAEDESATLLRAGRAWRTRQREAQKFNGPTEFAQRMSESPVAQACLASHWVNYAYGRKLPSTGSDACSVLSVQTKFKDSGYNVQKLLLSVAESDAFNYLPAVRE